jgi:hypothetical protein
MSLEPSRAARLLRGFYVCGAYSTLANGQSESSHSPTLRVRGRFCGAARVYPVQNPRTARDNRPEQECLFEEPQACDVWGFGLPTPRQSRPELRLRASRAEEREGRRLVALRIVDPACMPTGPKRPARTSALGAVNDVTTRLAGGRVQSVQLIPLTLCSSMLPLGASRYWLFDVARSARSG